ncbi:Uma2 family endonuclease [Desmonostoc muscorum LEGE 12446]|uniref:Uma2 family endonuclease n=1 Tax=Desmonostoc muscorum LEGE 12446 TaxID=1828758 RepID=A0A8J6ZUF4_DESMC|nr:Uma2 family endonuclease [Desmonostoc muscorum]MCF2149659.1 Uma2 family endonuclease [Desmonostoc muscorum LEGE 12446]
MSQSFKTLAKWSVDDYHRMIEADILAERHVELLSGEIVEMTPESPSHTVYGEGLANYLRIRLNDRAWIREARPITLANSEPEPDIAVVRLPWFQYSQHHPFSEDIFWLIEISDSTLTKDLNEKQRIYAQAGILEYWVVDVKAKKVIVFRQPEGISYCVRLEYSQGTISPLAFGDVEVPIEKIFSGQILSKQFRAEATEL